MSPPAKGCLIAAAVAIGVAGLLFAGVLFLAIVGAFLSPSQESKSSAQASASAAPSARGEPRALSASVSDNPSDKLVGLSADEAFEYGRLLAHAMFDDVRTKSMDAEVRSAFGTVSESKIRSSMPAEFVSGDMVRDEARSKGVRSDVIDQFFSGFKTGSAEVRSGR